MKTILFVTKFLIGAFVFCSLNINAQTITTFAGGGTSGLGDGGLATAAELSNPYGGAFDGAGNYYLLQSFGSPRLRMIDVAGMIYTIAGNGTEGYSGDGGPATSAELNPQGFAVDAIGNVYIGDYYNNRIRRVDAATHIINTIAGTGVAGFSGDHGLAINAEVMPSGICLDPNGNIYFIDGGGYRVRKIDTTGIITTIAGNGTAGTTGDGGLAIDAELALNPSLCFDASGNLYLACAAKVRKIDMSSGIISTFAGTGVGTYIGDGMPDTSAQLYAYAIGMDTTNNNLYIADYPNSRIYQIDDVGIFHLIAGTGIAGFSGDDSLDTLAQVHNPQGVATDVCGNLYIADEANNRIRKVIFDTTGVPNITISANPGDTVCAGLSVTYTAAVAFGAAVTYRWYVDGSMASATTNNMYTYTPANGDSVRCVLIATSQCSGDIDTVSSNTINMVVTPTTIPTITLTSSASAAIGSVVTVNAAISGASSSYSINWYDNGGLFTTTTVPVVTFTKGVGTDNITATVIPASVGCYDSSTSGVFTITDSTTGIATFPSFSKGVSIFPNPAHSVVTIAGQNITNVTISNLIGQTQITEDCNANQISIPIETLPAGVYAVKVTDSDGGQTMTKIVKE